MACFLLEFLVPTCHVVGARSAPYDIFVMGSEKHRSDACQRTAGYVFSPRRGVLDCLSLIPDHISNMYCKVRLRGKISSWRMERIRRVSHPSSLRKAGGLPLGLCRLLISESFLVCRNGNRESQLIQFKQTIAQVWRQLHPSFPRQALQPTASQGSLGAVGLNWLQPSWQVPGPEALARAVLA